MGTAKLAKEKKLIWIFVGVCLVVFIASLVFLIKSVKTGELGSSFLTAMLLFISGYGLIVFAKRLIRYRFLNKLILCVEQEKNLTIAGLSNVLEKSEQKIEKELTFAINNGFIYGKEIINGEVVDEQSENIHMDMRRIKQVKTTPAKQKTAPQKKTITSEKCPNCGAKVRFEGEMAECPYCGNSLKKA